VMAGLLGAVGLGAAACGSGSSAPAIAGATGGYPLELPNCEATVRIERAPERIVLLELSPASILAGLGVLDRVVARAGAFPTDSFDEATTAQLGAIPALSEELDATGHLQINQEVVIAQEPDLVLGLPDGLTREALREAGAEVLVPEGFCGTTDERASFEAVHREVAAYGRVLDRVEEASALSAALQSRIDTVTEAAAQLRTATAAVLYPSVGGGPLYTYGASSMATAQLDALGIENVFASTPDRVFEIGAEVLLAADPDLLIVLHQHEGGEDGAAELIDTDQLAARRAVRERAVLPLLFHTAEPASPLVVDGLERIHGWLLAREG
jgi:iron complex transport system substrate-binding protein